nr:DUF434 domain-containing protein [uncultured Aminipila sp.]
MGETTKRGYSPNDQRDFTGLALETMEHAAEELYFLLNRGYPIRGTSTFIGNHYLLSERQRVALARVVSSEKNIAARKIKQKHPENMASGTVNIDGFNEIITLEVALSGSPVLMCRDGTFRDLAGLRGTYRLIDKTNTAIQLIISELQKLFIKRAVFWLDAPVSNSGRLKTQIAEIAEEKQFEIEIQIVNNVDKILYGLSNVISSDSIILDHCTSWLNLNEGIFSSLPGIWIIDFNK